MSRIEEVRKESKPVVDVDGSYLYKKYKMLASVGKQVSLPDCPPPLTGWQPVCSETCDSVSRLIPTVTQGSRSTISACVYLQFLCLLFRFTVQLFSRKL